MSKLYKLLNEMLYQKRKVITDAKSDTSKCPQPLGAQSEVKGKKKEKK